MLPVLSAISSTAPACTSAAITKLLSRCRPLSAVKQLHAHLLLHSHLDRLFHFNHFLSNLLSLSSANCGDGGRSAERFRTHDVCSTASLTRMLLLGMPRSPGKSNEAIAMFHNMREAGVHPDRITLVGVLSSCTAVGALELGAELDSYVYVGTALGDMYAKCGDLDKAIHIRGHHDAIQQQFELMRNEEGLRPDEITFIGVLSACMHTGLLEYGHRLFNSLIPVFKITPKIEHY
ncbi:hypothetical protein EJB05_34789, partial [Eragrostis curvula]